MRRASALLALLVACAAWVRAAEAQPTAVPTPAGAGAVAPSDQTAVKPGLPDDRANPTLTLGGGGPAPSPWPPQTAVAPPAATLTPSAVPGDEPGRSEPNTGPTPAAAGSVHRKPSVAGGRPVSVTRAPVYTVLAFEAGKSLALRAPDGTAVSFPLAKKADVAAGVGPGSSVTIRTKTQGGKKVVTQVREAGGALVLTNVN